VTRSVWRRGAERNGCRCLGADAGPARWAEGTTQRAGGDAPCFQSTTGGNSERMQSSPVLRKSLEALPQVVTLARRLLVDFAKQHCLASPEIADTVALTVSEAVGNVVRHAYRDGRVGPVELDAHTEDDSLVVVVRDRGAGLGKPTSNSGQGLGLRIMQTMADTRLRELPGGGFEVALRFPCHSGDD
jgi:anti-sigma regulatory factor (Ser/Thr protein kinase)